MTGNLVVLLCSCVLILLSAVLCWVRLPRFTVVDIYILFVGIYFGCYSFIKGLLHAYFEMQPLPAALVFLHIIIIIGILWGLTTFFPESYRNALKISSLYEYWSRVNTNVILFFLAFILTVELFGWWQYGFISHVDIGQLQAIGKPLPYWFSCIHGMLLDLIFCTFLALAVKIVASTKQVRRRWWVAMALLFVTASTMGRRPLFNMILVWMIIYLVVQKKEILQFSYLKWILVAGLSLFIFSNLFQTYRGLIHWPPSDARVQKKHPLAAALDTRATIRNLAIRPSLWGFNYFILKNQLDGRDRDKPVGAISWLGLENSIPRVFWPRKKIVSLNDLVATRYGVDIMDYSKNNYGFLLADFGYLSFVILPLMLAAVFLTMGKIILSTKEHPLLLWLSTGLILNYLINIEQNIADIFILYRNLALLIISYTLCYSFYKLARLLKTR
jgi:hypothetical protein